MESNKDMKPLKMLIENIILEKYNYLFEGIDIDIENRTVSYNSSHENNIQTSRLLNPTYSEINGVKVISIFKRKETDFSDLDGNPLVYALKNMKGWKFKNPQFDILGLLKDFIRISEKIDYNYDCIITIPSNNELNKMFLHRLNKIIKSPIQITNYLHKLDASDVYEDYFDWKKMSVDYGDKYPKAKQKVIEDFNRMIEQNEGYFSYKFLRGKNIRSYVTKSMYALPELTIEYAKYINGKNILILDDTISGGNSISGACKEIMEIFEPKSITVITLFSAL